MSYVYLAIAIIGEFLGTTFLKMSDGFTKLLFSTLALVAYGLCFFFLAKSLEGLDISLAYAVWAGVGIVIVNLFGAGH